MRHLSSLLRVEELSVDRKLKLSAQSYFLACCLLGPNKYRLEIEVRATFKVFVCVSSIFEPHYSSEISFIRSITSRIPLGEVKAMYVTCKRIKSIERWCTRNVNILLGNNHFNFSRFR